MCRGWLVAALVATPALTGTVISLVPTADGATILAIVDRGRVETVDFLVAGERVARDSRAPFQFEIAKQYHGAAIEAIALDGDGTEVGRVTLPGDSRNPADLDVRIVAAPRGTGRMALPIVIEPVEMVERVQVLLEGQLQATLSTPPWEPSVVLDDRSGRVVVVRVHDRAGRVAEDAVVANETQDRTNVSLVEFAVQVFDRREVATALDASSFHAPDAEVEFLDRTERPPTAVVLVADLSPSTRWGPEMAEGGRLLVDGLVRPEDRIGLIAFRDQADVLVPLQGDRMPVLSLLPRLRPGGKTSALWDAVSLALAEVSSAGMEAGLVVVVSDGEAVNSISAPSEVRAAVSATGVPVVFAITGYTPMRLAKRSFRWRPVDDSVRGIGGLSLFPGATHTWPELVGEIAKRLAYFRAGAHLDSTTATTPLRLEGPHRDVTVRVLRRESREASGREPHGATRP